MSCPTKLRTLAGSSWKGVLSNNSVDKSVNPVGKQPVSTLSSMPYRLVFFSTKSGVYVILLFLFPAVFLTFPVASRNPLPPPASLFRRAVRLYHNEPHRQSPSDDSLRHTIPKTGNGSVSVLKPAVP